MTEKCTLGVCLFMIRVREVHPIGIERCASWVKGKVIWVCWVEGEGTVPVDAGVREKSVGEKEFWRSTPRVDVPAMTTVELPLLSTTTLPPPSIPIISHVQQTPAHLLANVPSSSLQDLPNFGYLFEFDHRLKTLETNFSEFMQTNQFVEAISLILGIVDKYLDHRMNETVKVDVRLQSDRLRDEAQAENEDFLNQLDENIQKIIKEQVKVQVSKILLKIEKTINEELKVEVLTRSSNSSKISHVVAADLSELELKKILIDKMDSNNDTIKLKRHRDDEDKDEKHSAGSNRGSKGRREGKEPESTRAPKEKTSKHLASQLKGLNLTTRLLASLHQ
nr:hypothetical protein [Tanacetum cinerariifolium]